MTLSIQGDHFDWDLLGWPLLVLISSDGHNWGQFVKSAPHVVAWTTSNPGGWTHDGWTDHGLMNMQRILSHPCPWPDTERQFKVGIISNAHSQSDNHAKGALDNRFWFKLAQSVYMGRRDNLSSWQGLHEYMLQTEGIIRSRGGIKWVWL